ncbi:MAG: VOC family protein [Thaumarchaeota archaeon]|nr:MAG: VOC family protein [Nitrososphaerota archaeon]
MPRVIHFEIVADNPERAMKFYKEVFGWEFNKWEGPQDYWLVKTGEDSQPGINGGLTPKTNQGSGNTGGRITNSIDVPSIDEFSNKISMEGGKVLSPKVPIPGVGYLAICEDTEGISFGIIQYDRNAK